MNKQDINLYNLLVANGVLNTPPLNDLSVRTWGANLININGHYSSYLLNILQPNSHGPIEKHPYIDLYSADCNFQREILLLGTFPPSSYINNLPVNNLPNPNIQNNNPTHYFYGNMNDLWFYLFGLNGEAITIPNIQAQLNANNISISDVFSYVQRNKMISAFDSEYRNIVSNCNIEKVFHFESNIHTILLTSGSLNSFLTNTTSTLTGLMWVLQDCLGGLNNFSITGDKLGNGPYYPLNNQGIQNAINQQDNGIIWWLKSEKKKIRIINLPSPAPTASRQMKKSPYFKKWLNYKANLNLIPPIAVNANVNNYLNNYPGVFNAPYTKQYRQEVYQMVLNNTIQLI
jgi:hypothetical protein